MDLLTRTDIEALKSEAQAGVEAFDRRDFAKAHDVFTGLLEVSASLGVASAYLHGMQSLVEQELGHLERAYAEAVEAVRLDPIHPSCVSRFADAAAAVRLELERLSRDGDEALAERLYAALLGAAEADAGSHVAMARVALRRGELDRALTLLEATALLAPARADAWEVLCALGERRGDAALVSRAREQLDLLTRRGAPYGVPSPDAVS